MDEQTSGQTANMEEEKVAFNSCVQSKTEASGGQKMASGIATIMANTVSAYRGLLAGPSHRDNNPSSNCMQHFSKPSLSYIALIATVILSSPCQKLNLASIYRAMEEQFPHLQNRGPGWRNSVRHNLSVNTCFVKVGRCEDGRGHYWGIHRAHLRDFEHGNFRLYRKARGRRETEPDDRVTRCLTRTETSCSLGKFSNNRSLSSMEPRCPVRQSHRYQWNLPDCSDSRRDPWSISACWGERSCWMRHYYFPRRIQDTYSHALARSCHANSASTSGLASWKVSDPGTPESYGSRFMTPPLQLLSFPRCCCDSLVLSRLIQPSPYY